MVSDRLDRVLAAIDAGLQSSPETGHAVDLRDRCARCQRHEPAGGGDLCAGCRAFLLGDAPEPEHPNARAVRTALGLAVSLAAGGQARRAAFRSFAENAAHHAAVSIAHPSPRA